jgi:hypothetical protein
LKIDQYTSDPQHLYMSVYNIYLEYTKKMKNKMRKIIILNDMEDEYDMYDKKRAMTDIKSQAYSDLLMNFHRN